MRFTKHLLFLFLDGVGLGKADSEFNPFFAAHLPALEEILSGRKLIAGSAPLETERATLVSLDAILGIPGLPQSATGQAALINGENVPAAIGGHYGPKPNRAVSEIVAASNIFKTLRSIGLEAAFLNAFPPAYFEAVGSGRRLPGTIALAAVQAGISLRTLDDLIHARALSADFTGQGLRERLNLPDIPVITLAEAGKRLANLSQVHHFSLFEYWLSDYAGHAQDMPAACRLLRDFDRVIAALVEEWDFEKGLIVITSDHGNLEDLSTRRHTLNDVPCLVIGDEGMRRRFVQDLRDLTGIAPAIRRYFTADGT